MLDVSKLSIFNKPLVELTKEELQVGKEILMLNLEEIQIKKQMNSNISFEETMKHVKKIEKRR